VYNVVKWFTPVVKLEASVGSYWATPAFDTLDEALAAAAAGHLNTYGWGTLGIYAAAALALAVCAFFLYRARRLESAGDVVSVKAMRPVFKYGVALCAGLAFGVVTRTFTGGGETLLMIAIVIWGVIGYFAAQMLLDKSFRVFHKWKGAAAVAAVFIAVFVVVVFDLTGFETRVPDPASVQEVHVWTGNAVYLDDDGDRLDLNVTDPEVIRLLNVLHRAAVAQRDEEWRRQNMVGDGTSVSLDLDYTLQGGGRMSRRYSVWLKLSEVDQEGTAAWAVQKLFDNRELYWEAYGFAWMERALAEGARLDSVMFDAYVGDYTEVGDVVGYGKDAQALLAAVKEDFFAGRIGVRRLDDKEHWNGGSREASLYFTATDPVRGQGAYRVSITLQKTASSTIAELRRLEASLDNDQIRDAFEEWLK
ncbi:MAG: hypothetical protein K2K53_02690, partial [Oscillospiraceae bacterium]|nr:hypothetical protein [Oscillospiraceae bacterium]